MRVITRKQHCGDHETYLHYFDWKGRYLGHVHKRFDDQNTTHPYQVFVISRDRIRVVDEAHPVSSGMTLPMECYWPEHPEARYRVLACKEAEAYLIEHHFDEEVIILTDRGDDDGKRTADAEAGDDRGREGEVVLDRG